jgi:hypothetical protein
MDRLLQDGTRESREQALDVFFEQIAPLPETGDAPDRLVRAVHTVTLY